MFSFTVSALSRKAFQLSLRERGLFQLQSLVYHTESTTWKIFIFFTLSVRFDIDLLNHCSPSTVLVHTVSITAHFDASTANIFDFDKFSVTNTIFASSNKSFSTELLSLYSRTLYFYHFCEGIYLPNVISNHI